MLLTGWGVSPAHAEIPVQTIPLKALDVQNSCTGSFNTSGWSPIYYVDAADSLNSANVSYWHLEFTNKTADVVSMALDFSDGTTFTWTGGVNAFTTNGGGNNPGWVIGAPAGVTITSGSLVTSDMTNPQFNVSGFKCGQQLPGSMSFAAKAVTSHTLTTTTNVYQKTIQPVMQETQTTTYQPTFKRTAPKSVNDTLVSRLQYSDDTAKAVPTNGGTFKNGHTYVSIPAADGTSVTVPIADSSFNANGKKTPDQYNTPIGYSYTATVSGNNLVISFDNALISVSVGAYVVGADAVAKNNGNGNGNNKNAGATAIVDRFPGNAPSHQKLTTGQTLVVPLPAAPDENGNYDVYLHIESLSWYSGPYEFAGWQTMSVESTTQQVDTKTTVNKVDSSTTEEQVVEPFTGGLTVVVTRPGSTARVFSGTPDDTVPAVLTPGVYTVTLYNGEAIPANMLAQQDVTVTPGANTFVDFGTITIPVPNQSVTVNKWLPPLQGETIYLPVQTNERRLDPGLDPTDPYAILL